MTERLERKWKFGDSTIKSCWITKCVNYFQYKQRKLKMVAYILWYALQGPKRNPGCNQILQYRTEAFRDFFSFYSWWTEIISFSHLKEHKFRHNFADTINPFVNVMFLIPWNWDNFFLRCRNNTIYLTTLMDELSNVGNTITSPKQNIF